MILDFGIIDLSLNLDSATFCLILGELTSEPQFHCLENEDNYLLHRGK